MKLKLGLFFAIGFLSVQVPGWAVPNQITYQGTLKQTGVPVNGLVNMQFNFVDSSNNQIPGTSLVSEPNVQVTNGLFSLPITLPGNVDWSHYTPYLQISIGGQALNPPQAITSNLYSIVSQTVVDGSITQAKLATSLQASLIPPGSIMAYAGSSIPTGWLICDGSPISRNTYSSLYASIGITWGAGDGSTTFNLPDLRGRTPIGTGQGSGLTQRILGQSMGEERHTMLASELPVNGYMVTDPGHSHTLHIGAVASLASGGGGALPTGPGTGSNDIYTSKVATGITVSVPSGGSNHNVMQPSTVVNFIIKD